MANPVENAAFVSVGRACGFSGLGVLCIVLSLSFNPLIAAKVGAYLSLATSLILVAFGIRARSRPYKLTETWLILSAGDRPQAGIAQKVVGNALRESYLWFAQQTSAIAGAFAIGATMLQLQASFNQ